jgi:hypothetical protein
LGEQQGFCSPSIPSLWRAYGRGDEKDVSILNSHFNQVISHQQDKVWKKGHIDKLRIDRPYKSEYWHPRDTSKKFSFSFSTVAPEIP